MATFVNKEVVSSYMVLTQFVEMLLVINSRPCLVAFIETGTVVGSLDVLDEDSDILKMNLPGSLRWALNEPHEFRRAISAISAPPWTLYNNRKYKGK